MINIANYTISYGSSGESVKKLQKTLNEKGYTLTVDGIFGAKTQSAVKDYQKKNGLTVDGIVGSKTWSSFNSSDGNKKQQTTPKNNTTADNKRPEYKKSDSVVSAENKLSQWESSKPDEYASKYSDKIDELLNKVLAREDFNYNLSEDPLYEQYRDIYVHNGKKAMKDTIGEATALTGGYGNSYAQAVGQQAYDEYLNELNGIALDLRDRAYETYTDEGDKLVENITVLRSLEGEDYDRYLSALEQYYADGDYLLEKLSQMSDDDFDAFLSQVEAWENDRDYAFKKYQDDMDRAEFEQEMAFKRQEAERDQQNADRDYMLALQKASSSGKSSSKDDEYDDSKYAVYPKTYKEFVDRTGYGGIMTKNLFLESSTMKELYGDYTRYLQEMYKKYS